MRRDELTVDSDEPSQGSTYSNFHRLRILHLLITCLLLAQARIDACDALNLPGKSTASALEEIRSSVTVEP